jgi:drug/metabolite transporter, DME family
LRESSYHLRPAHFPNLFALAIISTIGGFYCTNKALSLLEASKVQLIEMTEPFFASFLGFLILKQKLTIYDMIADMLIFIGIGILEIDNIKSIFEKTKARYKKIKCDRNKNYVV